MAVFKTNVNRLNPTFDVRSFLIYFPAFEKFLQTEQGKRIYEEFKPIVNGQVFESVWGAEWKMGFSNCLAHYIVIWAKTAKVDKSLGATLNGVASMGASDGLLVSWSVGEVSKSYDFSGTMLQDGSNSAFWNQTPFGRTYYSRWKQLQPNDGIFGVI